MADSRPASSAQQASLVGKVALVTGSGRGIGQATALALAARGAHVAINDVDTLEAPENIARAGREPGGQAVMIMGDVSRSRDVERLIGATVSAFGRLDILINNAGVESIVPLLDLTEAEWDRVTAINLKGE